MVFWLVTLCSLVSAREMTRSRSLEDGNCETAMKTSKLISEQLLTVLICFIFDS
jgi:hypothetical protein